MTTPVSATPVSISQAPSDGGIATPASSPKEHLDAFVRDVKDSLEDAETSVKNALSKLHKKRHPRPAPSVPMPDPAMPVAVVDPTPVSERPPVLSPAPNSDAGAQFPLPVFSQAKVPAVSVGLVNIKTEIEKLIAANGGSHLVLESILKAVQDGLASPDKEAVVVLTEVAKLMGQFILDEAGFALAHRP
jgi:hypothetical protein